MKLKRKFYLQSANKCVKDFLGKKLIFNSPKGKVSGIIIDVESYPAFVDKVHHGNKRTPRTEVLYGEGGYAYVYLIYGAWHQFAIVVNKKDIPDVVFIRGVIPIERLDIIQKNWGSDNRKPTELTNSPGKLCKSFGITKELYGTNLTGNTLWIEDVGVKINNKSVKSSRRIGINPKYIGANRNLRYWIPPKKLVLKP
ncbi:DNA-3-methyladenine glycosylase [Patescibacteria group bacterium]|nr:DNA-3-methyladenine glycosylase [Patescibacteria group bacterium]